MESPLSDDSHPRVWGCMASPAVIAGLAGNLFPRAIAVVGLLLVSATTGLADRVVGARKAQALRSKQVST